MFFFSTGNPNKTERVDSVTADLTNVSSTILSSTIFEFLPLNPPMTGEVVKFCPLPERNQPILDMTTQGLSGHRESILPVCLQPLNLLLFFFFLLCFFFSIQIPACFDKLYQSFNLKGSLYSSEGISYKTNKISLLILCPFQQNPNACLSPLQQ